jgi:hypothetical protein
MPCIALTIAVSLPKESMAQMEHLIKSETSRHRLSSQKLDLMFSARGIISYLKCKKVGSFFLVLEQTFQGQGQNKIPNPLTKQLP